MNKEHPGYRARNLDVATAYGLTAGLCDIKVRMRKRKDCPTWFLIKIDDLIYRSNCLIRPLIEHRNEIKKEIITFVVQDKLNETP